MGNSSTVRLMVELFPIYAFELFPIYAIRTISIIPNEILITDIRCGMINNKILEMIIYPIRNLLRE